MIKIKGEKIENIFIEQILRPSQMDICFSEKCNLNCSYCFVNKTSTDVLDLKTVKKAINTFYLLPNNDKTITFTTSEPFLYPDMFMGAVNYIFLEAKKRKINIRVVATTNGVLFNKKMQDFVATLDNRFTLNFSLDGDKRSHDAYRKFKGQSHDSIFEKAMCNFDQFLERRNVRVIATITPKNAKQVGNNAQFIVKKKFKNIDIFPQMFVVWPEKDLGALKSGLNKLVNDFNDGKINGNLRLLNRLWGSTHYAKILLGSDGKFYLFEWVLPLKHEQRKVYIIGEAGKINMQKRQALFELLFEKIENKTKHKCVLCKNKFFCSNPLPLYLWCIHNNKDFAVYFENFCQVAKTMIDASKKIKHKNKLDSDKWKKNTSLLKSA